ncbi:putative endopeptidase [Clostridium uliginosum]|uniref:Putative endopeptidase n=2 Tax=Clostridium uliginosum TaxID=119641 RepID=A0A1I1J817_9CLOT|nr:putative endopeptidase [Clostridium uliginosum]
MMKQKIKKIRKKLTIFILIISLCLNNNYVYAYENNIHNESNMINISQRNVRLEDDFYNAINKDWLKKAKLPSGYTTYGTFEETGIKVNQNIKNIIENIQKNREEYIENSDELKIINLYENYLDNKSKKQQGIDPISKYINKVNTIKTLGDLREILGNREYLHLQSLITVGVDADLKNSDTNILYIGESNLGLGNSEYYKDNSNKGKKIQKAYKKYIAKLYTLYGDSKSIANKKTKNFYDMEEKLAKIIPTIKERAEDSDRINKFYNIYKLEELDELAPNIKFSRILECLNLSNAEKIVVNNPEEIKVIDTLINVNDIENIKNFIITNILMKTADFLSIDFRDASNDLNKILYGSCDNVLDEDKAVGLVNSMLCEQVGKIYVKEYFSEECKNEVEGITKEIINNFKKRINNLTWMSTITKEKALKKLETINVKIGYPNKWNDYSALTIRSYAEGGSLVENLINIYNLETEKEFSYLNYKVDNDSWAMSPQTVNAYYNPIRNEIVFPAAILQNPFYDRKSSKEKNLGGIGVVIGHELTHAFDNVGSQFDETGRLNNWWTDSDYNEFNNRSKKVIAYYSSIELENGEFVNGKLTVGENISDLGGVACVLDIAKELENSNLKDLFENYATIWKGISTKEMKLYLLRNDVHSPKKVRVNGVLSQFEEFYKTYDINSEDKMYVYPENRVGLW